MEEVLFSDIAYHMRFGLIGLLASTGTVSNAISLSFFLRHQRETLADKHLIALNITDLLVCLLSPASVFCYTEYSKRIQLLGLEEMTERMFEVHEIFITNFALSLALLSCFFTAMLSFTRTLALTKPLYIINTKLVRLAHWINVMFSLAPYLAKFMPYYIMDRAQNEISAAVRTVEILYVVEFFYVLATVFVVGVCCAIVARALRKPPEIRTQQAGGQNRETRSRKATVMILVLSLIFSICNGVWIFAWVIIFALSSRSNRRNVDVKMGIFGLFLNVFLLTANSCLNPIVYMTRNSRLNTYTKSLFGSLKRILLRRPEQVIHH